jgi:hypothetical protein
VRQLFVVRQVLIQGAGGDLGVAQAELVHQQLVRVAPAVVLARVRIEQADAGGLPAFLRGKLPSLPRAHRRLAYAEIVRGRAHAAVG